MRVRVSYAIDLDEVPSKVDSIVKVAIVDLEKSLNKLKKLELLLENDEYVGLATKVIDDIRQEFSATDQILADGSAIISGYVSAKYPEQPVAPVSTDEEPD